MKRKENLSTTKLACMLQLKQNIHNLKMTWPCGIKSIDQENKETLKRLQKLMKEQYYETTSPEPKNQK